MPSNLMTLETGFPTFTGKESPEQQILALHNYLFQLRESLQYSLRNLSAENFNATALQNMTDAQKNELTAELKKVNDTLSEMRTRLDTISGRVVGAERDISAVESEIDRVAARVGAAEEDIVGLQTAISDAEAGLKDLDDRLKDMEDQMPLLEQTAADVENLMERQQAYEESVRKLSGAVGVAADGSITIGAAGRAVNLVGTIYINGVLCEGGTT